MAAVMARMLSAHAAGRTDVAVTAPELGAGAVTFTVGPGEDPASAPSQRRRTPGPGLVLGLLLVAALVLAFILGSQALDERARAQGRSDALAAARQIAMNFSTLDYRTFDRDTARVTQAATGMFRSDFAAQAAQIKQVVLANKSVSTGQVGQVALVSSSATTARVLVVLDATVTNTSSAGPTARHYRVQLDLAKVKGRWLASQLQFVG